MKKLKTYEAPTTRVAKVTLKTSMLAASIMQDETKSVESKGHEIGSTYEYSVGTTPDGEGNFTQTITGGNVTWE
jgi:hypothetical protein